MDATVKTRLRSLAAISAISTLVISGLVAVAVRAQEEGPSPQAPPSDSLDAFGVVRDHFSNFDTVRAYFRTEDPSWLPRPEDPAALLFGPSANSNHTEAAPDSSPPGAWTLTARHDGVVFVDHQQGGLDRFYYADAHLTRVAVQYEEGSHERVATEIAGGDRIHTLWSDLRNGFEGRTISIRAPEQDGVHNPYEGRGLRWACVEEPLPDGLTILIYFGMRDDGSLEHVVLHAGDDWKWLKTGSPEWNPSVPEEFWNPFAVPSSTGPPRRKQRPPPRQ